MRRYYFSERTYDKHGEPKPLNVAQEYVLATDYNSLATAHAALEAKLQAAERILNRLTKQVHKFAAEQGEWEFYTGDADEYLAQSAKGDRE